ncbi:phosphotransferase [Streptomyces sp. TP-A0874]|uniref:phosphotransferase n=1 Tax=Streptomyces sp. TP-A0874 TaxID=549819 RepID=UPI0009A077D8|nr:phosphotransferase [Streptomyces sp. TP-A0874]
MPRSSVSVCRTPPAARRLPAEDPPQSGGEQAPDAQALGRLLHRYRGAGEPLSCERVAEGLLNRGYRLTTTRGVFFLKHHLHGSRETIARHHRATAHLDELGLPVAPAISDTTGTTVRRLGGHCYALHPWVPGRHRSGAELSVAESRELGTLLGLVHTCLAQVMPNGRPPSPASAARADRDERPVLVPGPRPTGAAEESAAGSRRAPAAPARVRLRALADPTVPAGPVESADPRDTLAEIDELLRLARDRQRDRDAFDELAERVLVERRRLVERHAHRRPAEAAETASGWVHGDFHPLNLIYRGKQPAAIVDWDRLGVRPRAEEAVRSAALFFLRPRGTLDLVRLRAYARAYRGATGATPEELAAAVHRVWWERLNDFWMLRWRYQLSDRRTDQQFPATAALSVWWTGAYAAVCAAFTD